MKEKSIAIFSSPQLLLGLNKNNMCIAQNGTYFWIDVKKTRRQVFYGHKNTTIFLFSIISLHKNFFAFSGRPFRCRRPSLLPYNVVFLHRRVPSSSSSIVIAIHRRHPSSTPYNVVAVHRHPPSSSPSIVVVERRRPPSSPYNVIVVLHHRR